MSPCIDQIKAELENSFRCTARHVDSTPVVEIVKGEVAWDNVVETFELTGHPDARYCYAWLVTKKGKHEVVIVLESPRGVNSPEKAVKLALVSKAYHKRTKWWPGMS